MGGGKRIEIIGGGIAGLCLGIRVLRRGAEAVIYERGDKAGGLCQNWRRGVYDFNGCLHWVLGVREGSSFHDMWRGVADIDSLSLVDHDERVDIELPREDGGHWHFHLYNDTDRLEAYLLTLAPEDSDAIRQWTDAIRTVERMLPNLPPWPTETTAPGRMAHYAKLWKMWSLLPIMNHWGRLTNKTFAQQMKSPLLRAALERLYMDETRMTVVIFGQAYMAARVAAYPIGGSAALTGLLERTFKELGGKLVTGRGVKEIRTDGNRATGLTLNDGTRTVADAVCSCADWRWTVGDALGGKYVTKRQKNLLAAGKETIYPSYCRVHIGYAGTLETLPHFFRLNEDTTLPDGTQFCQMEVEVNSFDPTLAPQGKTTLTVNYTTREGMWWIGLRRDNPAQYAEAKDKIRRHVLATLSKRLGQAFLPEKVEVADVTTPATYHRYTANALGSSQGWAPMDNLTKRPPVGTTLRGLRNFVIAGHWLEAGGGIPIALLSALKAEKELARQGLLIK